jgi:hypothetical protein
VCIYFFLLERFYYWYSNCYMSWDSSVGIMIGCALDGQGIMAWFLAGARSFSHIHCVQFISGAYWVFCPVSAMGSFPRNKVGGCQAVYSPVYSTEMKNAKRCTFTPLYIII